MTIILNTNEINWATKPESCNRPTAHDLLNKIKVLQEIKKKFSINPPVQASKVSEKGISATQAALGIEKKTLKEIFEAKPGNFKYSDRNTISKIERLAEDLLKTENNFPDAVVCYTAIKVLFYQIFTAVSPIL